MLPKIKTIQVDELILEYYIYGQGAVNVICLHGHGRTVHDFEFITSPSRRVIAIHLFYHGNSYFPEDRIEKKPLQSSEFLNIFNKLLIEESIDKFHLFAFSQGGRFSLCILLVFWKYILTLTLISPDGMDNNSFYNWSSRRKLARMLFKRWENNPKKLKHLSTIAVKIGLMRPKVKSFVDEFSGNTNTFKRASLTWRAFREIQPDPELIGKTIKNHHIPFRIIMGSYDQVIRPKQAYAFEKKCGLTGHVIEIQNGHNFFKTSSINKFRHLLPFMD